MKNMKSKILKTSLVAATAFTAVGSTLPVLAVENQNSTAQATVQANSIESTDWYNNVWNNNEEKNSDRVVLTPGATENDLNFGWYSETTGAPQVRMSTAQDMSNATVFEGTAQTINKTNNFETYVQSNKVSANGFLTENTTYYYQYRVGTEAWSETYTYQTHSFTNFQAVLVGDPQIGASGSSGQNTNDDLNIANDTAEWNKTLETALGENGIAKDASFILSAGDQIDYSSADKYNVREQEYAGFLYPSVLRSTPLATTIGNHESQGDDYQLHYNNPNDTGLGTTTSGGDYYYSYGDTLFISLNSNSRNVEEHRAALNEAVASHLDATWKVVLFHHDIYGSGAPHSDVDGANLRILFAPLMDEFDIDVCLTGHDHSYARTYQILDGKVVETEGVSEGASSAYNPEGTLYIAAGSASGSKFYDLNVTKQYYIAERNNTAVPTFSTLDFTDGSLTIKTYDYSGNKYATDVTLTKDGNATSIQTVKDEVQDIDTETITSGSKARIDEAVNNVNTVLESKSDATAINELQNKWNTTSDPLNYYAYAQNGYQNDTSTALKEGYSTLLDKTLYGNDTNKSVSSEAITAAYNQLVQARDEVVTKAEFSSLQALFDDAGSTLANITIGNKAGEYTQENVDQYQKTLADLKTKLNEATITKTEYNTLTQDLNSAKETFLASQNKEDIVVDNGQGSTNDPVVKPGDETNQPVENTENNTTNTPADTTNTSTNRSVDTADNTNIMMALSAAVLSLAGIGAGIFHKKRKVEE